MNIRISDSVKKKADKCPYNYSCLTTGKCGERPMCQVDYADGEDVLFLATRQEVSCPYRMGFGDRQICVCPVYFEIHKNRPPSC